MFQNTFWANNQKIGKTYRTTVKNSYFCCYKTIYQMEEQRKEYIDSLLQELNALEKRVLTIKNENTAPFSFFRESFDKTQKIMRLLHEMEVLQVDDMKHQMERLVSFLSESENRKNEEEKARKAAIEEANARAIEMEKIRTEQIQTAVAAEEVAATTKVILPEYKDPRKMEKIEPVEQFASVENVPLPIQSQPVAQKPAEHTPSPTPLDLTKGISLNDRFLFQRELFNNNRTEMNVMMSKLGSFGNYSDAERFLKETTAWDFENQTTVSFLEMIQKGFK